MYDNRIIPKLKKLKILHHISASGHSIIITNQRILTLDSTIIFDIMKLSQINIELFKCEGGFILRETQMIKLNIEHNITLDLIHLSDLSEQDMNDINILFENNKIKYKIVDGYYQLTTQVISTPFDVSNRIIMMISSLSSKNSTLSINTSGYYNITQIHGYQKYLQQ